MQKLFRLTALLAAAMLVVCVVGCGDDDDDDDVPKAEVKSVSPEDGSTVVANAKITVEFTEAVDSCTINGKETTLSSANKKAEVTDAGLSEGSQTVSINWKNKDGSDGSDTVSYTVEAADPDPPKILSSSPEDGDTAVKPDDINDVTKGIVVEFDEDVTGTLSLTLEGTDCGWQSTLEDKKITLVPLKGNDVGYEKTFVVVGTVADGAGNELEVSITFTTESKEEG